MRRAEIVSPPRGRGAAAPSEYLVPSLPGDRHDRVADSRATRGRDCDRDDRPRREAQRGDDGDDGGAGARRARLQGRRGDARRHRSSRGRRLLGRSRPHAPARGIGPPPLALDAPARRRARRGAAAQHPRDPPADDLRDPGRRDRSRRVHPVGVRLPHRRRRCARGLRRGEAGDQPDVERRAALCAPGGSGAREAHDHDGAAVRCGDARALGLSRRGRAARRARRPRAGLGGGVRGPAADRGPDDQAQRRSGGRRPRPRDHAHGRGPVAAHQPERRFSRGRGRVPREAHGPSFKGD